MRALAAHPLPAYTCHEHRGTKHLWSLTPVRRTVIIGDSNLGRLPPILLDHVQVDCYPGATFSHATNILCSIVAPVSQVKQVVLSFGLRDRSTTPDTSILQARAMLSRASATFPHASIWVPLINTDPGLPQTERDNVTRINQSLIATAHTIPLLPERLFHTEADHVHWSAPTAQAFLKHWSNFLNLPGSSDQVQVERKGLVNLSSHFRPSPAQVSLLLKGLSFVPTLNISQRGPPSMRLDIAAYHRRLKLAAFFEDREQTDPSERPRFLPKSSWTPRHDQLPPVIHRLVETDLQAADSLPNGGEDTPNLTQEEVEALRQLRQDPHLIIKPADKGAAVVIMDRDKYVQEAERQLNMPVYYRALDEPLYLSTANEINQILARLTRLGYLVPRQRSYLMGEDDPKPRKFYLLPKIHKNPASWPVPYQIPAGRPIVSDCGSETYGISEYIDSFLNPLSNLHPSYVKDTYDFIAKVRAARLNASDLLFSMDVDSLYTNIEAPEGLRATEQILLLHPKVGRPDRYILQLLEIALTRNDFEFNNKHYLQLKGVAMGKKFAPAYADIYMARWEADVLPKCPLQPSHYLRYLDDIWGVWPHPREDFNTFVDILNSHHASIKVKYVLHETSMDFLDTTTFKGTDFPSSRQLDVKVFFKDTDTHALLHMDSYHPKHTFPGVVKSQLLRFHRICTQREDFLAATHTLFQVLVQRGYSRRLLRNALSTFRVVRPQRETLHNIPLVTTFNRRSRLLNQRLKLNLQTHLRGSGTLEDASLISAYRKNRSLGQFLVRSGLRPLNPTPIQAPAHFGFLEAVQCPALGSTLHLAPLPPSTYNAVYMLTCTSCGLRYVGETGASLQTRLTQHLYEINNCRRLDTHLVPHFLRHGVDSLHMCGLECGPNWTLRQRRACEQKWIWRLSSLYPKGLNTRPPAPPSPPS